MNKSAMKAFFLSFIPGAGHLYLRKFARGFIYLFFILSFTFVFLLISVNVHHGGPFLFGVIVSFAIWLISMIDIVVTIIRRLQSNTLTTIGEPESLLEQDAGKTAESSTASTVALSIVPGLGHMHLGLTHRGLTFLIGFFGVIIMIIFVSALTGEGGFLAFLGVLPVIWLYSMFDAMQLLQRKNRGEELSDRTIFEDFEEQRLQGTKSKKLAMFLALLPGAGHMYLGLQRRGLQFMAVFLFSIYVLDVLYLSIFLYFIPILWFYSFFDALQQVSRYDSGEIRDVPLVEWLINHQKWVGIGLLALGLFYMFDQLALPLLQKLWPKMSYQFIDSRLFQTSIVSVVLIVGGIKLLLGSKKKGDKQQ